MNAGGQTAPTGSLSLKLIHYRKPAPLVWKMRNFPNYWRGAWRSKAAELLGVGHVVGTLRLELHKADGTIVDYGVVSKRVLTTVGAEYIVDAFQNLVELENMKFHGFGTGGAAEAVGNTGLTTELTTQYASDIRPTGTTVEGASANIFRTVGTLTPDSGGTIAVTEHGIFSANAAGVLLDRTLFSVVNVVANADSLQATYELTIVAGS